MSDDLVNIEIDGQPLQARKGSMIIESSDNAGIAVPRFCYHRKLTVAANCRMCLVEVEKAPKPLPACATPVAEGMKIHTRSALARRAQKSVMEFLLINHPLDCPICDQGGECELQDVAMGYGRDVSRFQERKRVVKDKNIGPLISTDMTRCIHCTRCVRFGEEIAGMPELGATGRGERMEIGTFVEKAVSSELSGNVIDLCPVGALTNKPFRFRARAWEMQERPAVAAHDCLNSSLGVHVRRGEVMRIVPGENEAVNEVWLADRDRYSFESLAHPDRLLAPMVREGGEWREVDWEAAMAAAGEALKGVPAERLGALVSPQSSVEEAFLAQKVLRGLGSGNVDSRLRQADLSDQETFPAVPTLGQPVAALQESDCVLLIGANTRKEQPLINHRIRKAARAGANVMVLNPVAWDFNYALAESLVVQPRQMPRALAGILAAAGDHEGVLADAPSDEQQVRMAEALKSADKATILLGGSVEAHPEGAALRALAARLAAATGATLGVLSSGGNAAGAALAGALPHRGTGGGKAEPAGIDARAMLGGALSGLLTVNVEPEFDCAEGGAALRTLDGMSSVVALTAFQSEAMRRYATVMLPVAPFLETDGSYVNIEGLWQQSAAAVPPRGQSRPAWRILRVLGNLLELDGFDYMKPGEIADEVRGKCPEAPVSVGQMPVPDSLDSGDEGDSPRRIGEVNIYAVDGLVRRSPPLQETQDATAPALSVHPDYAAEMGIEPGTTVRLEQADTSTEATLWSDPRVPLGCVYLPAGTVLSASLGDAFGAISVSKA